MKDGELKPCPFCGGGRVHFDTAWASSVILIYCPDCTAVVSFGANKRDTYKFAVEAYNRRADPTVQENSASVADATGAQSADAPLIPADLLNGAT